MSGECDTCGYHVMECLCGMPSWETNVADLSSAAAEFEANLPGWWWTVGMCSVGAHASCAVDGNGPAAHLLEGINQGHPYDGGFHVDTDKGQPAEALRQVMQQALDFMGARR